MGDYGSSPTLYFKEKNYEKLDKTKYLRNNSLCVEKTIWKQVVIGQEDQLKN